tara:strand:+ start:42280 stop:43371 length:1092 start_codon:yes stop_codon:yes gene_type:complete
MKIPYLDLKIEKNEKEALLEILSDFFDRGRFVGGRDIEEYEQRLSNYFETSYIHGVASGNSALYLALKTLDLKNDDEVIVPNISWVATAHAVEISGGHCVFADVNDMLCVSVESIKKQITNKTKAIIVVHFMGIPCEMDKIIELAELNNIKVIEDCSQAFGASYKDQKVGTFGDFGCFSTNCMKVLAGVGDSGFLISKSEDAHKQIQPWLYNGVNEKKEIIDIELCHRLDPIQAVILSRRIDVIDKVILQREVNGKAYLEKIKNLEIEFIPFDIQGERVFYGFTLVLSSPKKRELFIKYMMNNGIELKVEHEPCLSALAMYQSHRCESANAQDYCKRIVNLPVSEVLSIENLDYIIKTINDWN